MEEVWRSDSLTSDLMIEIISWLPVKTLARFRCVCRRWRSLTYDPSFIRSQYERASWRPVFLMGDLAAKGDEHTEYVCNWKDVQLQLCSLEIEGLQWWHAYALSNSVGGLVCAYERASVGKASNYIMNPITGEGRPLPANYDVDEGLVDYESLILGFDTAAGRFKVVSLAHSDVKLPVTCRCAILTLDADTEWRHVGRVEFPFAGTWVPVFLNGALHWESERSSHASILTFDISDEKFGPPLPIPAAAADDSASYQLLKHEDRLTVVAVSGHCCDIRSMDAWMLTDYTNRVWTKIWSIDTSSFPAVTMKCSVIYIDGRKVFFQLGSWNCDAAIYCYDVQSKRLRMLTLMDEWVNPCSHVESLVSPFKLQALSK